MSKPNDIIFLNSVFHTRDEDQKMENIEIKNENGIDIVQYQPKGVCCKMMMFKIQNDILIDAEFIGGCNGNLRGISSLTKGMNINDIVPKLSGIPCGARPTSCPDQLTLGIKAYLEAKKGATV